MQIFERIVNETSDEVEDTDSGSVFTSEEIKATIREKFQGDGDPEILIDGIRVSREN